jgi:hypothetical protein
MTVRLGAAMTALTHPGGNLTDFINLEAGWACRCSAWRARGVRSFFRHRLRGLGPSQNLVAASEDSSKIKFVYQNKLTSDRGGRHQGTPNAARAAYSCINFSKPCQSCGGSSRR